jgi:4-hydroxy-4-methyl-2-oxoglutarate aldolase
MAKHLGSATLHEAAGRIGALPSGIKPIAPSMRLAGPAFTVHVPQFDNLWIHRAVYEASEGDVLVISTSGGIEAGYWGDILNEAAIERRLGGIVIDGGVRDSVGLIRHAFPVFSNGVSIRGTIKDRDAIAWLRQPIRIGDVVIRQRDLVVGDADGVVVIPEQDAKHSLSAGQRRESDEAAKIERIRAGERTIDMYGLGSA